MTTLSIPDMHCEGCTASVARALTPIEGVSGVIVDLGTHTATVTGDAATEKLIAALGRIGFPASVASAL